MTFPSQSPPADRSGDRDGRFPQRLSQAEPGCPDQIGGSLEALRARLARRRRERLFGSDRPNAGRLR
jgi:hypothetical protein